ncbi:nuclear transport factor 2 family protein [Gillisia sp. M10.2A]|uniref:Nuclear transport factor 2 family protein n=1 Tax=Gillisia lutea TaxID=2909668 RepID=A0ABS9EHR0_9FLAO|nr:nuclear transport factor 2 family protein [Gillisia lutea]MCF4101872.1 nuclear transport factor 2 family protein [Gillisia lutea]
MKILQFFFLSLSLSIGFISSCYTQTPIAKTYVPEDPELYNAIVKMDSIFFDAYNNCNIDKQASILADDIEFYHDQSGLSTSKQDILDATKRNICGKVTRELVKGSIQVYPLKGFGAVEMGMHKFHNNQEPANTPSKASKFIVIWKFQNDNWQIFRVVSLH